MIDPAQWAIGQGGTPSQERKGLVLMERPTPPTPFPARPTELTCKRRICGTVLARVIGVTLVLHDNTRIGPVTTGMIFTRKCPRCGTQNVKHLAVAS